MIWQNTIRSERKNRRRDSPRIGEWPFDSERKMMSTLHRRGSCRIQYTKGAPDRVLPLCSRIWREGRAEELTGEERKKIENALNFMASRALRVMAFAMEPEAGR